MKFEWDETKNKTNIRKHRIDFADVPDVFKNPLLTEPDVEADYGEDRWMSIGLLRSVAVVVVFTERQRNTIRIISARKANQNERERYYQEIAH